MSLLVRSEKLNYNVSDPFLDATAKSAVKVNTYSKEDSHQMLLMTVLLSTKHLAPPRNHIKAWYRTNFCTADDEICCPKTILYQWQSPYSSLLFTAAKYKCTEETSATS